MYGNNNEEKNVFRILIKQRGSCKQFGMTEEPAAKKSKLDETNSVLEQDSNIIYVMTQSI